MPALPNETGPIWDNRRNLNAGNGKEVSKLLGVQESYECFRDKLTRARLWCSILAVSEVPLLSVNRSHTLGWSKQRPFHKRTHGSKQSFQNRTLLTPPISTPFFQSRDVHRTCIRNKSHVIDDNLEVHGELHGCCGVSLFVFLLGIGDNSLVRPECSCHQWRVLHYFLHLDPLRS